MRGTTLARFEDKVFLGSPCGCHYWIGAFNNKGYGMMLYNGKVCLSHRVSYELNKGLIPNGLDVLHSCDNPLCVNPDHLFVGTHQDNMTDRKNKKRGTRGVTVHGAKLDEVKVKAIREYLSLGMKQVDIAKLFGIDQSSVSYIKSKTWKHV